MTTYPTGFLRQHRAWFPDDGEERQDARLIAAYTPLDAAKWAAERRLKDMIEAAGILAELAVEAVVLVEVDGKTYKFLTVTHAEARAECMETP